MPLLFNKPPRICISSLISTPNKFPVESRRHIRIKKADDTVESGTDPSEKEYRNVNGRSRSGPSEAHSVDKKGREGSLDPQSQGAQGSMRGPKSESPSHIYGQVYKEGKEGVGGTERGGQTDAAPPGSWWESMKHKLGFKGNKGE